MATPLRLMLTPRLLRCCRLLLRYARHAICYAKDVTRAACRPPLRRCFAAMHAAAAIYFRRYATFHFRRQAAIFRCRCRYATLSMLVIRLMLATFVARHAAEMLIMPCRLLMIFDAARSFMRRRATPLFRDC